MTVKNKIIWTLVLLLVLSITSVSAITFEEINGSAKPTITKMTGEEADTFYPIINDSEICFETKKSLDKFEKSTFNIYKSKDKQDVENLAEKLSKQQEKLMAKEDKQSQKDATQLQKELDKAKADLVKELDKKKSNQLKIDGYRLTIKELEEKLAVYESPIQKGDQFCVPLSDYTQIGNNTIIIENQTTKTVLFKPNENESFYIENTLFWNNIQEEQVTTVDEFGNSTYTKYTDNWNNQVNDLFLEQNNETFKFGAWHNVTDSNWEQYKYSFSSNSKVYFDGNYYGFRNGLDFYKIDLSDICNPRIVNETTNETREPECDISFREEMSVTGNYTDSVTNQTYSISTKTYYLDVEFYSTNFIDPTYTIEAINTTAYPGTFDDSLLPNDKFVTLNYGDRKAMYFDGVDDYVSDDLGTFYADNNKITLEIDINDVDVDNTNYIASLGSDNSNGFKVVSFATRNTLRVELEKAGSVVADEFAPQTGSYTFVFDITNHSISITKPDGTTDSDSLTSGTIALRADGGLYIGKRPSLNDRFSKGSFSNVKLKDQNDTDFLEWTGDGNTDADWTDKRVPIDTDRMAFDGVDDYVEFSPFDLRSQTISFTFLYKTVEGQLFQIEDAANSGYRFISTQNAFGSNDIVIETERISDNADASSFKANGLTNNEIYTISLETNATGNIISATIDGSAMSSGGTSRAATSGVTADTFFLGIREVGNFEYSGTIYDFEVDGVHLWNGYGNTNADWVDQVGSNDGTIFGSPNRLNPETGAVSNDGTVVGNPRNYFVNATAPFDSLISHYSFDYDDVTEPRMYFDGVDNEVQLSTISLTGDFNITWKMIQKASDLETYFGNSANGENQILRINPSTVRVRVSGSNYDFSGLSLTTDTVDEWSWSRTGSNFTLTINGVSQTIPGSTSTISINRIGQTNNDQYFTGSMWDIEIDVGNDGTINHEYNGYGNTNADWTDQVGSNDGTVLGSPEKVYINNESGFTSTAYDLTGNHNAEHQLYTETATGQSGFNETFYSTNTTYAESTTATTQYPSWTFWASEDGTNWDFYAFNGTPSKNGVENDWIRSTNFTGNNFVQSGTIGDMGANSTIEFKMQTETSGKVILVKTKSGSREYLLYIPSTTGRISFYNANGNVAIWTGDSIIDGEVHNVKIVKEGDTFTTTVDGVTQTATKAFADNIVTTGLGIGKHTDSSTAGFVGTIYDVKVDIGNTGSYQHQYNGYGNTDADWTDQVGSNDGTVVGSPDLYGVHALDYSSGALRIAETFDGYIDELMIFDKILNQNEIEAIYTNQSSRFKPNGTVIFPSFAFNESHNRVNVTFGTTAYENTSINWSAYAYNGSEFVYANSNVSNQSQVTITDIPLGTTNISLRGELLSS